MLLLSFCPIWAQIHMVQYYIQIRYYIWHATRAKRACGKKTVPPILWSCFSSRHTTHFWRLLFLQSGIFIRSTQRLVFLLFCQCPFGILENVINLGTQDWKDRRSEGCVSNDQLAQLWCQECTQGVAVFSSGTKTPQNDINPFLCYVIRASFTYSFFI